MTDYKPGYQNKLVHTIYFKYLLVIVEDILYLELFGVDSGQPYYKNV